MRRLPFLFVLLFAVLSLPATAWAHPGHDSTGHADGLNHYLFEPAHSLPIAAGIAASLFVLIAFVINRREARASRGYGRGNRFHW